MGEVQTGLTHVEVSNTTGKEEMTKNKFVEDACHDENRRNLSQTSKTSLVYSQLAHEIWFNYTSESCQQILQGHYNATPDTDEYTNDYLKHLIRSPNIIEPPQATVPTKIFQ